MLHFPLASLVRTNKLCKPFVSVAIFPAKLNVTVVPAVTPAAVAFPNPGSVSKKYSAAIKFVAARLPMLSL